MRLAVANILLCAGVLAFAIQWTNWNKPNVVKRIVAAAKPDAFAYGRGRLAANDAKPERLDGIPQGEQGR